MTNVICGLTAKNPGSVRSTFLIEYGTTLLLGRVAVVAQRPIVVKLSRERSVGLFVRASVCPVHCGKTADRIQMPFGIIGRTGPGIDVCIIFS